MENDVLLQTLQAVQRDIAAVRSAMATKEDLAAVRSEMATKSDLAAVRSEMATKEDLKRFATKEDLTAVRSAMATKEDLQQFATKEDLERFATKKDLQQFATKEDLDAKQVEVLEFMREYCASKDDLQRVKSEIMTHVDGLAAHNQKFDQELLMIRNRQDRLEKRMA